MYLCIDIERKHETSTMIEKEGEDRELNEGGWSDRESYTVPFTVLDCPKRSIRPNVGKQRICPGAAQGIGQSGYLG